MRRLLQLWLILVLASSSALATINCGQTSQSGTDSGNGNYPFATPCTTGSNSGGYRVSSIYYWVGNPSSTSFDLGVYSNSSNEPSSLLCHASTGTITPSSGWNSIAISGCGTIPASTTIWIGYITGSNSVQQGSVSGTCSSPSLYSPYAPQQGSVTLPNPFGTPTGTPSCYSFYAVLSTAYTATPSETNTASDTISRLATWKRGDTETNTASDALARTAQFGRGQTETNTSSDSLSRLRASFGTMAETHTATDALGRVGGFARADTETQTASDTLARLGNFGRGETETNLASDSLGRLHGALATPIESHPASDLLARLANFGRGITESNPANDLLSALKPSGNAYYALMSEVLSINDVLGRLTAYLRADTESYSVSDALARVASFQRGETETNWASDSLGRLRTAFGALMESYRASDALARLGSFRRNETELSPVSDYVIVLRHGKIVVLPRHVFALPGLTKTGVEPGRTKTGSVPGETKTGTAPVH